MDKREKPTSVSNTENNGKKYKFYRKPLFRKAPEVKQTKTSLARQLKANPLLKYDLQTKKEAPKDELNPAAVVPKISITHVSGKSKHSDINRCRLSSSDFNKCLLSSTLTEIEDNAFVKPGQFTKTKNADGTRGKQNHEATSSNTNHFRKTLSSKHLDRKKKELNEIARRGPINNKHLSKGLKSLRRSVSLESFSKKACYRIEEEETEQHLTESQSMKDLSHSQKQPDPVLPNSSVAHANGLPPVGELITKIDDQLIKRKQDALLSNCSYDEENKENIEVEILEAESYEDLKINNEDNMHKKRKTENVLLQECPKEDVKITAGEGTKQDTTKVNNVLQDWSKEKLIRVHGEDTNDDHRKTLQAQPNEG